jgi:hypothetical protein
LGHCDSGANHKESKKQGLLIPIDFAGLPEALNKEKELPKFLVVVEELNKPFIGLPLIIG